MKLARVAEWPLQLLLGATTATTTPLLTVYSCCALRTAEKIVSIMLEAMDSRACSSTAWVAIGVNTKPQASCVRLA